MYNMTFMSDQQCLPIQDVFPTQFDTLAADMQTLLLAQETTSRPGGCPADRCTNCALRTGFGVSVVDSFLSGEPIPEAEVTMERAFPEMASALVQFCVATGLNIDDIRSLTANSLAAKRLGEDARSLLQSFESICDDEELVFGDENLLRLYTDTHYYHGKFYDDYWGARGEDIDLEVRTFALLMDPVFVMTAIEGIKKERDRDIVKTFYFDPANSVLTKKIAKQSIKICADRYGISTTSVNSIKRDSAGTIRDKARRTNSDNYPLVSEQGLKNIDAADLETLFAVFYNVNYDRKLSIRQVCKDLSVKSIGDFIRKANEICEVVSVSKGLSAVTGTIIASFRRIPGMSEIVDNGRVNED
jgi:hypothetical protein